MGLGANRLVQLQTIDREIRRNALWFESDTLRVLGGTIVAQFASSARSIRSGPRRPTDLDLSSRARDRGPVPGALSIASRRTSGNEGDPRARKF